MNISVLKRALRREAVARILALEPDRREAEDAALLSLFPALPGFESACCVLLYASAFPEEFATGPLLKLVRERGKRLVCPRVDRAARRLRLFQVDDPDTDLVPGTLDIPEPREICPSVAPEEVDWVLVPGLSYDSRCYRIGRGAGHYDRLLPTLRADAPRWSLAFDCQWVDALPVEPHDAPLDGVVSPSRRESRHSR